MNTSNTSSGRLRKNQMYSPAALFSSGLRDCFPSASTKPAATPTHQVAMLSFTTTQQAFQKSRSHNRPSV